GSSSCRSAPWRGVPLWCQVASKRGTTGKMVPFGYCIGHPSSLESSLPVPELQATSGLTYFFIRVSNRQVGPSPMRHFNRLFLAGLLLATFAPQSAPALDAKTAPRVTRRARVRGVPTFADSTLGDIATFDDPVVRQAAIAGLGRYNGSVVAIDPNTGRVLSIVNQKLPFSSGFIPFSTIKPVIAVAALEESVVTRDTMIKVAPRLYLNLVEALAHSNNAFFEELGRRMGFATVSHYARLLGLGELAGYNLPEEQPGAFP